MEKNFTLLLIMMNVCFFSCRQATQKKKTDQSPLSELSVFNLPAEWTTHQNKDITLESLRGKVIVLVMVYTSCQAACPRLISDMKNIYTQLEKHNPDRLKMVLVSIDPKTDTPERLNSFAIENKIDQKPWLLLRSTEENTRELANVLAVKYKSISPIDFSHSNIISVFNSEGELVFQQEGLALDHKTTVETIRKQLK